MSMRIDGPHSVCRWFLRVFPTIPPRVIEPEVCTLNQTCYRVRCPEAGEDARRYAYWSYLERQNTVDRIADAEIGAEVNRRMPGRFTPMRPEPRDTVELSSTEHTGLGGSPLGDVPAAKPADHPPPKPAPQRIDRLREPGYLGSIIDIIT